MVCAPCLAAAGPPGIAVAAVGTVGYGAYKYISPKKKIKRGKKLTKRGGSKCGGSKCGGMDRHFSRAYDLQKGREDIHNRFHMTKKNYNSKRNKARNKAAKKIQSKFRMNRIPKKMEWEFPSTPSLPSTNSSKKGGGKQDKFKKGEIVRFVTNNGKKQKMKFVKNVPPNKISIKFPNAKKYNPILTVNGDKIEKMPKNIANTKHRQRTRRAALVRKKRGIKTKSTTKSSTLELPNSDSNSDNVDNLLKDMKI